jgi:lipopolysaccharide transport system ATP-binding protein
MSHIVAHNIVVEFPLYTNTSRNLKHTILHATTGGRLARSAGAGIVIKALDDLSFTFNEGDRIGLTGHNGSGKTTLLRILAGAYEPVSGILEVRGRISSLLDISMGMDHDATGYENIFLRGIVMGMKPREIRKKIPEIAEFTGLGEYLEMPMRTYSSGMKLRLAFAVSTSVNADIIIMDEWLSVGDQEFQEKASRRLSTLLDNAAIFVMASHSPELIARLCNRGIRLEHGRIAETFIPQAPLTTAVQGI